MNYVKQIKKLSNKVIQYKRLFGAHKSHRNYFKLLKKNNIEIRKLSNQQKKEVDKLYKDFKGWYSYSTHELYYSANGVFEPRIMPEDLFRSQIEVKLNEYDNKFAMSDKNYFDLFMPNVKFPDTVIRNIRGCLYDNDYNLLTKEQAQKIVDQFEFLVYKPSEENGFGRGVQLVDISKENPLDISKKDYVLQKVIKQHPALSALNESSVNVVRLITLFINDKVYPVSAALRIGGVGDFADNIQHPDGRGMIVIGIDENGKLRKDGVYSCCDKTDCNPAGIKFLGYEVPQFETMKKIAMENHIRFPKSRFIGWDFTVNENNEVVAIEYNIKGPGVLYYQYTNGPLFGDKTEELLEYVKKH